MRVRTKLVYGYGINDSDYVLIKQVNIDGKRKTIWICPFYRAWTNMLSRCYSEKFLSNSPTYRGCSVVSEWHYFMTFRAWMEKQDWEGKQLDKDILIRDNKIYGPSTCVFVDPKVNMFLLERTSARGEYPIGVSFNKARGKYQAGCSDITSGKRKGLGYFDNPHEAHQAWLKYKLQQAIIIAGTQSDERVAKALIDRYENYEVYENA